MPDSTSCGHNRGSPAELIGSAGHIGSFPDSAMTNPAESTAPKMGADN
jgi:hypothetical protein